MWAHNLYEHIFGSYNSGIDPCDDTFHHFSPDEWSQQTPTMLRTYLIQNLHDPHGPDPVLSWPISSSRPTGYSTVALELMGFKKGIKREIAAYPSLKDERYFDSFKRSLFIVAKSLQVVNLSNKSSLRLSRSSCSVSSVLTFKLTWVKPLSGD